MLAARIHEIRVVLEIRQKIRAGDWQSPTSGRAPGLVQANIVILPAAFADAFELFCHHNIQACPLLARSPTPGDPSLPALGRDIDIRFDVPKYRIWRNGVVVEEPADIANSWQTDAVVFALGCSFSFEEALIAANIEIRNISEGVNVPMYRTNIPLNQVEPFNGNLVVSMRPMKPADAIRAIQICTRFPKVHGAPVHFGDPGAIGIADLCKPDFGDAVTLRTGEVPVFWACGVTPQAALENARLPWAITHAPGHMLISEIPNAQLALM